MKAIIEALDEKQGVVAVEEFTFDESTQFLQFPITKVEWNIKSVRVHIDGEVRKLGAKHPFSDTTHVPVNDRLLIILTSDGWINMMYDIQEALQQKALRQVKIDQLKRLIERPLPPSSEFSHCQQKVAAETDEELDGLVFYNLEIRRPHDVRPPSIVGLANDQISSTSQPST